MVHFPQSFMLSYSSHSFTMRKLSFLLGSVGGALAGYVFSNKKLRTELMEAKDGQQAAKILGRHLSTDGQQVAKEVKRLAREHHFDAKVADGRQYVKKYYQKSVKEAEKLMKKGAREGMKMMKKAKRKVVG